MIKDQNETLANKLKFVTYQALSEEEKACKMEELLKEKEKHLRVKHAFKNSCSLFCYFFKSAKYYLYNCFQLIWPRWGKQKLQILQAVQTDEANRFYYLLLLSRDM